MNLTIDENEVSAYANAAAGKALQKAFGSWEVSDAIEKAVKTQLIGSNLLEAIGDQVKKDLNGQMQNIVSSVSKEIVHSVSKAAVKLINESMIDLIYRIRRGSNYMNSASETAMKNTIIAELLCDRYDVTEKEEEDGK